MESDGSGFDALTHCWGAVTLGGFPDHCALGFLVCNMEMISGPLSGLAVGIKQGHALNMLLTSLACGVCSGNAVSVVDVIGPRLRGDILR